MALSKSSRNHNRRRRHSCDDFDSDYSDSDTIEWSRKRITEEEIAEYLAKKAMKVAKKMKSHTVNGYSNDCNPFGDFNLNEKFVWRKKIERDVYQGLPLDDLSMKAEKTRQRERMAEIEKVKKRREERGLEKARHEEEMTLLARERSGAEFQDWEKKEEEFDFDQSKIRSEIRLREGRTKPIDVLIKHLDPSHEFDIEVNEPYMVFKGLNLNEIEELHEDIKLHLDLDIENVQYWESVLVFCDWELAEARKRDALVRGEELIAEERGVHASVEGDVKNLLHGKTYEELQALQSQIESKMRSGAAKVVEYWEAILKRLHIYKERACLKEIHANMLQKHLEILQQSSEEGKDTKVEENPRLNEAEPILGEAEAGSYSPQLLHGEEDEDTIDPEEDRLILERKRKAVMEQRRVLEPTPEEKDFEKMAMKAMGTMEEGNAVFGSNDEINLDSQVYWLHDKYRPRKPKYFNRIHTGYEWNKYNRTHYDHDNQPPKTVLGYKFNIFYPDLVDKPKAPNYTIEKDGDSTETCIIRFHAGPPYEDIAFRIVNKEWDYSHKKGFKSTFERGILQLYFNIKRYRYRR